MGAKTKVFHLNHNNTILLQVTSKCKVESLSKIQNITKENLANTGVYDHDGYDVRSNIGRIMTHNSLGIAETI